MNKKIIAITTIAAGTAPILFFFIWIVPHLIDVTRLNRVANEPRHMYATIPFADSRLTPPPVTAPTFTYRGGLTRTGVVETMHIEGPLRVSWRSEDINRGIHSASKSSPAADASGVYVGADDGWFYAFDLDGRIRWRFYTGLNDLGIHGTAVLDEDRVWIGSYNGYLYCLRKSDGRLYWSLKVADAIGSSAMLDGPFLYASAETGAPYNGYLLKLDARTGHVLWQSMWLGEQIHSSVAVHKDLRLAFAGANNGRLFAFRTDDGALVWHVSMGGPIKATPTVIDDKVYVTSWSNRIYAIDAKTGTPLWETDLGAGSQSSVTYVPDGDILVVAAHIGRGMINGVRRSDGKKLWSVPVNDTRSAISSGVAIRQTSTNSWQVWIGCGTRKLCAFEPQTGHVLSEVDLGRSYSGTVAASDGALFVALDEGGVIRLDPAVRKTKTASVVRAQGRPSHDIR